MALLSLPSPVSRVQRSDGPLVHTPRSREWRRCAAVASPSKQRRNFGPFEVSPMGLGTWSWGNRFLWGYSKAMDAELQKVFDYAVSQGVNLFDTADSYGTGQLNGRSETLLGRFTKEFPGDVEIHIATKFAAYPWRVLPTNIVSACRGSLRRLEMKSLSLGQLHWSTANYAPLQEIALQNGLAQIYERGLVQTVGVSNYGPKQLKAIHKRLTKRGVPLSSAQIQFSLLSYGPEQRDLKSMCDELGIVVISYSPLALGILTGVPPEWLAVKPGDICGVGKFDRDNLPPGPRAALFRHLLPKVQDLLQALRDVGEKRNKSSAQVAINWCISKGTVPIPGVKNMTQAEDNLGALGWALSAEEIAFLDDVGLRSDGKMIQNIFQTK